MGNNTDISSGLLESYVLGTCTAEENKLINELCNSNPAVRAEVEAIEKALIAYSSAAVPEVSSSVKHNLFQKINPPIKSVTHNVSEPSSASTKKIYRKINLYVAMAASVVLVLGLPFCIIMYNRVQKTDAALAKVQQEKEQYSKQLTLQEEQLNEINNQLSLLSRPETKKVKLNSTGNASVLPSVALANVQVYWNSQNHETYITITQMPPPPSGKQYQLWAIVDGKPVDAGMINLSDSNDPFHKMKDITNAQAFAITLENEGGSSVPTLTAMCMAGNV